MANQQPPELHFEHQHFVRQTDIEEAIANDGYLTGAPSGFSAQTRVRVSTTCRVSAQAKGTRVRLSCTRDSIPVLAYGRCVRWAASGSMIAVCDIACPCENLGMLCSGRSATVACLINQTHRLMSMRAFGRHELAA